MIRAPWYVLQVDGAAHRPTADEIRKEGDVVQEPLDAHPWLIAEEYVESTDDECVDDVQYVWILSPRDQVLGFSVQGESVRVYRAKPLRAPDIDEDGSLIPPDLPEWRAPGRYRDTDGMEGILSNPFAQHQVFYVEGFLNPVRFLSRSDVQRLVPCLESVG